MADLSRPLVPGVRKIAVLRANALGDFIFILPAMEALRCAYPQAEIVLLAKPWHAAFLRGRPSPIDRVVVVPPYRGVRDEPGGKEDLPRQERFFRQMQDEQFDIAIQLHGGGKYSNPFISRLGARLTVGLRSPDALPLDCWVPYIYWQNEILRYLEVVSLIGANAAGLQPHIALLPSDLAEAEAAVPSGNHPLILLHPGAGDPRRRWPEERFAALGDALRRDGATILISGTAGERPLGERIISQMREPATSLCGRLSLGGLAGLLSRCTVVVSNDSGPLHLAMAVGTPTVGIYWCGNLITAGPPGRTRHRPLLSWTVRCPGCGADATRDDFPARAEGIACKHDMSFVAGVEVEQALAAARDLLQVAANRTTTPRQ